MLDANQNITIVPGPTRNQNIKLLSINEQMVFIHVDNTIDSSEYSSFISSLFSNNPPTIKTAKFIFIFDDVLIKLSDSNIISFINKNVISNNKYLVINSLRNVPNDFLKTFDKIMLIEGTEYFDDIAEEFKKEKIDFLPIKQIDDVSSIIGVVQNTKDPSKDEDDKENVETFTIEIKNNKKAKVKVKNDSDSN